MFWCDEATHCYSPGHQTPVLSKPAASQRDAQGVLWHLCSHAPALDASDVLTSFCTVYSWVRCRRTGEEGSRGLSLDLSLRPELLFSFPLWVYFFALIGLDIKATLLDLDNTIYRTDFYPPGAAFCPAATCTQTGSLCLHSLFDTVQNSWLIHGGSVAVNCPLPPLCFTVVWGSLLLQLWPNNYFNRLITL